MDNISKQLFLIALAVTIMTLPVKMVLAHSVTASTVLNTVTESQDGVMLTFRFDDGLENQYNNALPILSKYDFPAVEYVFTDPIEYNWDGYMNWSQIEELQNTHKWEIGGHTKTHPNLTRLSDSQIIAELSESKTILESHGLEIESFASPFGIYDNRVLGHIARFYQSHGSAWSSDFNSFPSNDYEILVQEINRSTSVATVKAWIDEAVASEKWLVLLLHGVVESNPGQYDYLKNDFETIVDYVNTKDVPVVTVSQALNLPGANLIPNPSFENLTSGWADNWARTDTEHIVVDTNNNGCSPEPVNSLKFFGGTDTYSVYTENFIDVDPNKTYLLRLYFNCQDFTSGGVDVFIDEHNSEGQWLDWKWQTGIWKEYVGYKSVIYAPSQNTGKILLWIESVSGSDLECYIDRVIITENIDPDNIPPNFVLNPSFENLTSEWADNWIRTETNNIVVDTNNKGCASESKNSLKFTGSSASSSAYTQDFIDVDPNKTYLLKLYFNCQDFTSGGVDVFIDEHNSEGEWLDWKWQTGIWKEYVGYKSVIYTPSQETEKLLIWIEEVSESNLECYVDNIVLSEAVN